MLLMNVHINAPGTTNVLLCFNWVPPDFYYIFIFIELNWQRNTERKIEKIKTNID